MANENLRIRNCKVTDLRRIQRIENESFEDPYPSMTFWTLYLDPKTIFRVAITYDELIGYSIVKLERKDGESLAHLISLAVDPSSRRKGVGSKLVDDAIVRAKAASPTPDRMELEVRIDNEQAVSIYLKFGFSKDHIISDYYGVGKHALLMKLDFK